MGIEQDIYSGNGMRSHVKAVGIFRLFLENGYILDLVNTFYVPSFSKNLISISKLVPLGFEFNFIGSNVYLFKNSTDIGSGILVNGLYKLNLNPIYEQSLLSMHDIGSKRNIIDESSTHPLCYGIGDWDISP
jgi:hypothetical protein